MPSFGSDDGNVLYLIVCAAPPARQAKSLVSVLISDGWDVCVVATPAALAWIDPTNLQDTTGHPVRSEFRAPDEPEFAPRGDAVLVAPATFNTINKCVARLNDSLALGLINEAIGSGSVPLALVPWVNSSLTGHPAYPASLARLETSGARVTIPGVPDAPGFEAACVSAGRWLATTVRGPTLPPP
jgi:phosphopantothenoylcysteine synthetase/decarboxylase